MAVSSSWSPALQPKDPLEVLWNDSVSGGESGEKGDNSESLEDGGDEEAQEEAQDWRRRRGRRARRRLDGGGLDLGAQEGGQGDVGHEGGAGVVDEGVDLFRLLVAGFDLENKRAVSRNECFLENAPFT